MSSYSDLGLPAKIREHTSEDEENSNSKGLDDDSSTEFNPEKLVTYPTLSIDMDWVNFKGKPIKHPLYFSNYTTDFLFQFAFQKSKEVKLLHASDYQFVTGPTLLSNSIPSISLLLSRKHRESMPGDLSFSPGEPLHSARQKELYIESLPIRPTKVNSDPLPPDVFYPDVRGFLGLDLDELERYLEENVPRMCMAGYSKGVIERARDGPQEQYILRFKEAANQYCHPSLCAYLRMIIPEGDKLEHEGTHAKNEESHEETVSILAEKVWDEAINLFISCLLNTGLFYVSPIDKHEQHSSIVYNFSVLLDCSPGLRRATLKRIHEAFRVLDEGDCELFEIERMVFENPDLLEALILYIALEIDRSDKRYFIGRTFLEYHVMDAGDDCDLGLLLGDIIDNEPLDNQFMTRKVVQCYAKAYRSANPHISTAALSRLTKLYQREFNRMQVDEPMNTKSMINLYIEIVEAHKVLSRAFKPDSMRFMLDHYYRCLCFITGERKARLDCHREIDNLLLNRKDCLKESLQYFQFFYFMGERGALLLDYFNVLNFLHYLEASLVSLRFASLTSTGYCGSSRFLSFALCKKEGIGSDPDYRYAVKVLMHSYLEAVAQEGESGYLEAGVRLYHMATVFEELNNKHFSKKLFEAALKLLVHSEESETITKKFIYYLSKILQKIKYLDSSGNDLKLGRLETENFTVKLWTNGVHLAYITNEDYIYQYYLEECIASNMFQYESFKNSQHKLKANPEEALKGEFLQALMRFNSNTTANSEKQKLCFAELRRTVIEIKREVNQGDKNPLTVTTLNEEINPLVSHSFEEISDLYKKGSIRAPSAKRTLNMNVAEPANHRTRQSKSKKLTILKNKEVEFQNLARVDSIYENFEMMMKVLSITELNDEFHSKLAKNPFTRVFESSELEYLNLSPGDTIEFGFGGVVKRAYFIKSGQLCRVFEVRLHDSKQIAEFFKDIHYIATSSPFILNYLGLAVDKGETDIIVKLISEDFDEFAITNGKKLWSDQSIPLVKRLDMFHDLLMAVQSLHFFGKAHFLLVPEMMVTTGAKCRLKLIIPFFMPWYTRPADYIDQLDLSLLVYISPNVYSARHGPIFAKKEFDFLSHGVQDIHLKFLNADIWSLAVCLIEMLTDRDFGTATSKGLTSYQEIVINKKKLTSMIEQEIKFTKSHYKGKIPSLEISKMMNHKNLERLSINKTVNLIEEWLKGVNQDFVSMISGKHRKEYWLYCTFMTFLFKDFDKPGASDGAAARSKKPHLLHLSSGLDYFGCVGRSNLPEGNATIRHNRHVLLEGNFSNGLLKGECVLCNTQNDKLVLNLASVDEVADCRYYPNIGSVSGASEAVDLSSQMSKLRTMVSPSAVFSMFESFINRKTYKELMNKMKERTEGIDAEVKGLFLEEIAMSMLVKFKQKEAKKHSTRATNKEDKKALKDFGIDTSSEEEAHLFEGEGINKVIIKKTSERLKLMSYEQVLKILAPLLDYASVVIEPPKPAEQVNPDRLQRSNRILSGGADEDSTNGKIQLFADPFGYFYEVYYNQVRDRVFYKSGIMRTGARFDKINEVLVMAKRLSSYAFYSSNLFEHRLFDALKPIDSMRQLTIMTMFEQSYDYCISVDLEGNQARGFVLRGEFQRGEILGANQRVMRVTENRGNLLFGKLFLPKEDLKYEGETHNLNLHGRGSLVESNGKRVYVGCFENGLPHGEGLLYDQNGKLSNESFHGYFRKGIKICGSIENDKETIEGLFLFKKNKETSVEKRMKKEHPPSILDCIKQNRPTFEVVGWIEAKDGHAIKYGRFDDVANIFNGFYKVCYNDGGMYRGVFAHSQRQGPFIMTTKDKETVIGNWKEEMADGLILWNPSKPIRCSVGRFTMNYKGELDQTNHGRIESRNGDVYIGGIGMNQYNGYGSLAKKNGSYYIGQFKDGLYHGIGERYNAENGTTYRGMFMAGKAEGPGILKGPKPETTLKGWFEEDMCVLGYFDDFKGSIYSHDVYELVSQMEYDQKTETYSMKGICSGMLKESKASRGGTGGECSILPIEYQGEINGGQITGEGVIIKGDDIIYEGYFFRGSLHEYGRLNLESKKYYIGEFKMNKATGYGQMKENNELCEGYFNNHLKNGIIIFYMKREKWRIGEYRNDIKHGVFLIKNTNPGPKDYLFMLEVFKDNRYDRGKRIPLEIHVNF